MGVALVVVWILPFKERELVETNRLVRHITYTLVVTNKSSTLMKKADFSVLGPNSHTRSQRCESVEADRTFSLHTDDLNNQILQFSFENLPPFAVKVLNIRADVIMQTPPSQVLFENRESYLVDQPQLHLDGRGMREQAGKLLGKDDLDTAANIYRWITAAITKTAYSEQERGALYALYKKSGDCTEFMHLFVALCRINRIPARGISGYIVSQDRHLTADELHDWAEVYIDGQWQLVDPYNKVFMEKEEIYVVMRVHGDRRHGEFFHRWRVDDERLHIAMKD